MEQKSKNKEYIKLVIILLVLFGILGVFLLYVSYPLLGTKTVVLATFPVDPFDLIRGQYITIGYEIGRIPLIDSAEVGDTVYVTLEEDVNGTSRYKSASLNKPSKDDVFIKGEIKSVSSESMRIEYGIEQYFFERGAKFPTRGMEVKVKLSNFGGARIVELLQDGEPIEIEYENKSLTS
ncbi:GDYXXLXY domain-containing protein [archaeon]|nr:GDYXXLXY domain-containing protein [archaeon]MBT4241323.1 GDYXXLXY domain-containing protein [archaeon]MBT4418144.1 GDYXXLXY domain-containing protein [archaeon]